MGFSAIPQPYEKVVEIQTVTSTSEANHLLKQGWDLFDTLPGDSGYSRDRASGEPSLTFVLVKRAG